MRIGLCFDGFYSIQEMIELARLADEIGMESIWMSDHLCFRDSLTTSMALLASTKKIAVAPAPMSPYSRHPIISAMSIATMAEFAPGPGDRQSWHRQRGSVKGSRHGIPAAAENNARICRDLAALSQGRSR